MQTYLTKNYRNRVLQQPGSYILYNAERSTNLKCYTGERSANCEYTPKSTDNILMTYARRLNTAPPDVFITGSASSVVLNWRTLLAKLSVAADVIKRARFQKTDRADVFSNDLQRECQTDFDLDICELT